MPWIDPEGNEYQDLPSRVRLADKTTRTADAVTPEVVLAGGWRWVDPPMVEPAVVWEPEPVVLEPIPEQITITASDVSMNVTSNFTL